MELIPQPSGIDLLEQRLRQLEQIDTGRTLSAATISGGNIKITQGGSITISNGGHLIIKGGDIQLPKGKIDGQALKEQIEPKPVTGQRSQTVGFTSSANWREIRQIVVPRPVWATSAIFVVKVRVEVNLKSEFYGSDSGEIGIFYEDNPLVRGGVIYEGYASAGSSLYGNAVLISNFTPSKDLVFSIRYHGTQEGTVKAIFSEYNGFIIWQRIS